MANFLPLIRITNAASHFLGMNQQEYIIWFQEEDMVGGIRSIQKLGARLHRMLTSFHRLQLQAEVRPLEYFATRELTFPQSIKVHFLY